MSLEINPAAASAAAQQAQAYTPPADPNVDAGGVDSRRYTKFDRTATDAGTAQMSFGDFLDMINPLEHIPVASSVYRAVTGEQINPVARVTGDILYGGVMGAASAIFGGVSAVADAGLEGQTGKDSGGLVLAALFGVGSDNDKSVQLADAGTTAPATAPVAPVTATASASPLIPSSSGAIASAQAPVSQKIEVAQTASASPMLAALAVPGGGHEAANDTTSNAAPAADALMAQASAATAPAAPIVPAPGTTTPATAIKLAAAEANSSGQPLLGGISLANVKTTNKQPYGGVMAPLMSNSNAPDMTVPVSQSASAMRMGHTIYTNGLANGVRTLPPALSPNPVGKSAVAPIPTSSPPTFTPISSASTTPGIAPVLPSAASLSTNVPGAPMPTGALQDMMLKAISQYKNAASNGGAAALNLTN